MHNHGTSGGSTGAGMSSLSKTRYWYVTLSSCTLTACKVKIYELNLNSNSRIGQSSTLTKTNLPGYCYNAGSPLIINQNTTWSTAQTVCSNINVTAGTFTISIDQVIPKQATITVYNGAILIVDNCTITNANIVINSGGKIILQNNGILELNEDDSITVNGMKDMTYGEIKKMRP